MTELEKIAEKATAIIFLNAQWIGSLADTLKDNDIYSETAHQLVEHARKENKQVFNDINELRRKLSADTIPRAEVAAALEGLRADWQHQKIVAIDPSESLYPDQQGHNSMVESFVEDLDATITKLGLAPGKDGSSD